MFPPSLGRLRSALRLRATSATPDLYAKYKHLQEGVRAIRTELRERHGGVTRAAKEQQHRVTALERHVQKLREEMAADLAGLTAEVKQLQNETQRLRLKESQLRAVMAQDARLEPELPALLRILDGDGVRRHIECRVARASIDCLPCPHLVVDEFLPDALYHALVAGLPPIEAFNDKTPNKRQVPVPFGLASAYGRSAWRFVATDVLRNVFVAAIVDKLRDPLNEWLRGNFDLEDGDPTSTVTWTSSYGRVLLRTAGYYIRPHRDPNWGFLTCLLYVARPGDDPSWGTQLFTVDNDGLAPTVAPYWIDEARCTQVRDVAFVPNRLLVFLNSTGAHGSRIPECAGSNVERYAYQFRVGPDAESIARLLATMPADRRASWEGKVANY